MTEKTELEDALKEKHQYKEMWHKESSKNIELTEINKFLREVVLNLSRALKSN